MYKLKEQYLKLDNKERIYNCPVPVVALSGSIATGKSSASSFLMAKGMKVICADKLIHQIYTMPETREILKTNAPQVLNKNNIDFKKLRSLFFQDLNLKEKLENHLYSQLPILFNNEVGSHQVIIYDIPLLYEKGLEKSFDLHGIVYTPKKQQKERLKKRDAAYTLESINSIIANQLDIEEKKKKAQFVIDNTSDLEQLEANTTTFISNYFIKH